MGNPFVGEIRLFAGNFAPAGWAFCDGSLMSISENDTLFALIGTTYGGDGQETFAVPDLRGRVPVHQGTGSGLPSYTVGEQGGVESVTISGNQTPIHNHPVSSISAPGTGNVPSATSRLADLGPGGTVNPPIYRPFDGTSQVSLNSGSIGAQGGNQPHNNIQPTLAASFIISLFGIFPSQ
jgi:microcystin-dependent protein